jgi:hypothetical protein
MTHDGNLFLSPLTSFIIINQHASLFSIPWWEPVPFFLNILYYQSTYIILISWHSCRSDSLGLQHSAPSSTIICLDQRAHFGRKGGIDAINFLLLDSIRHVKELCPWCSNQIEDCTNLQHRPIKALVRAHERPEHVKLAKSNYLGRGYSTVS